MLVVYHFQTTNVTLLLQVFYLFYNTVVVNIVGSIFSFRSAVFRVHVSDFLPIISPYMLSVGRQFLKVLHYNFVMFLY